VRLFPGRNRGLTFCRRPPRQGVIPPRWLQFGYTGCHVRRVHPLPHPPPLRY
jgi:hypothetical protein